MSAYVHGATRGRRLATGVHRLPGVDTSISGEWEAYVAANRRANLAYARRLTYIERAERRYAARLLLRIPEGATARERKNARQRHRRAVLKAYRQGA